MFSYENMRLGCYLMEGVEVLVHMGLDTVELQGAPFTVSVTEGQQSHKKVTRWL